MEKYRRPSTRQMLRCPVFGAPRQLCEVMLPTYEDIRCYLFEKKQLKATSGTSKEPLVSKLCEIVATKTENIWIRASIPVISHKRVLQLIRACHDKYMKLL